MNRDIQIRAATLADKPQIVDFLRQMNLRGDDVLAPVTQYWVTETADRVLVGSVGLEFGVGASLLRSVAVSPDFRKMGLGRDLVNTALAGARKMGCKTIYLFSVSSGGYWQRMGFHKVPVDELVQALPEIPQVLRFSAIGKLATETGWKKELG